MTNYKSEDIPISIVKLGSGLNTASGPLNLQENESSDLLNADFDKFGSVRKRNGYIHLNATAIGNTQTCLGLYWYQTATAEKAINVSGPYVYRMDALDGTWDYITGTTTLKTPTDYYISFTTFNGKVLFTNDYNTPQQWANSGSCTSMTVPTGLTQAKFITNFQNYCIMANCVVSGVDSPTRWYWSNYKDEATWTATDFLEAGYNDGEQITGIRVLGDRLVIFKENSIWVATFTGDANIPFIQQKSNSTVGCAFSRSIQEIDNGLMFGSWDGLYYFDGSNSYKTSDRINDTWRALHRDRPDQWCSTYQKDKNRYWLSAPDGTSTFNNVVITWDSFNNAFSKYSLSASSLTTFRVNAREERVYFSDYLGYTYRADYGLDDYPSKTKTGINFYYYTNWKKFDDICDQKGIPNAYVYYSNTAGTITLVYSYDFYTTDTYTQTFSSYSAEAVGHISKRRDLDGRGRVVRFGFKNSQTTTSCQIDAIGFQAHLETKV